MPEITLQSEIKPLAPAPIAHGLTIDGARDLLDWLEAHGIEKADVEIDALDRVTVLLKH